MWYQFPSDSWPQGSHEPAGTELAGGVGHIQVCRAAAQLTLRTFMLSRNATSLLSACTDRHHHDSQAQLLAAAGAVGRAGAACAGARAGDNSQLFGSVYACAIGRAVMAMARSAR